ncbi:hypothetical protein [uncultured Gammaproteobacteria bacterium]|jgi:catechol 2,3-dioxygenase-like lactoylglutathione lyase family enzyme|uniref:Glyoxalase family protein n=4 Tax=sulfur-oxidizing symbionts TaxID=32036 RepID=A0ACA8ZT97_9GAMM|nr:MULTISPECIES: hypothetical protein [Gammaproteobacteria]CAC9491164.1 hypothetical protein [uncultured Gammaproteobacteria bacterium]CAB5506126.1 Glyoxalase family protein [Bathymodiolus thermophilus thioautotrophic gill symbiont]CAB5507401.1 Glyoxalase family protein [Bathymodiolus azoricus thioautotrophic gill symbiont]CAC9491397.1 hypothetical protein [uncultured Gammaproteobacteria bacterium]CAC9494250.1 hypothetical protein [uncultured Gammaproteobacteria bacterium]
MNIEFNHIGLRCKNIDTIATFFIEIIGLMKGFRPPFTFSGYWLYLPQNKHNAIIHIFAEEANFNGFSSKTNNNNNLLDHIAFSRNDYSDFIQHITNLKISFNENFVPDSNTQQVFVKGPENLIIEIDFINP